MHENLPVFFFFFFLTRVRNSKQIPRTNSHSVNVPLLILPTFYIYIFHGSLWGKKRPASQLHHTRAEYYRKGWIKWAERDKQSKGIQRHLGKNLPELSYMIIVWTNVNARQFPSAIFVKLISAKRKHLVYTNNVQWKLMGRLFSAANIDCLSFHLEGRDTKYCLFDSSFSGTEAKSIPRTRVTE